MRKRDAYVSDVKDDIVACVHIPIHIFIHKACILLPKSSKDLFPTLFAELVFYRVAKSHIVLYSSAKMVSLKERSTVIDVGTKNTCFLVK